MKYYITFLSLITHFCLLSQTIEKEEKLTVSQLKEDFLFMRHKIEQHHPNLYLYSTKERIDSVFDAMYANLNEPLSSTEFYCYLCTIQPYVKDGHNYLLPSQEKQVYYAQNAYYFPLNFVIFEGKAFITQNFSDELNINIGDEIIEFNGKKMNSLLQDMITRQVRDGYNLCYPTWITQTYFRSYYGFLYGFQSHYSLKIKRNNNEIISLNIDGLKLEQLSIRRKNQPKRYDRNHFNKGIFWDIYHEEQYAVLSIKSWSKEILKEDYKQKFKPTIDSFFKIIQKNDIQNIIIDLRNNQGGDGVYGAYLLRYLFSKPFHYFYSVKKYNKKHQLVNTKLLTTNQKPFKSSFKGNIYVLTNGGSFSNSSIFTNLIQIHKRGKIIGTETGGNGQILCGGEGYYRLPHSKINILKATHQMIVNEKQANTGRGVIPDILIEPSLDDILNNRDKVMEKTMEQIRKGIK